MCWALFYLLGCISERIREIVSENVTNALRKIVEKTDVLLRTAWEKWQRHRVAKTCNLLADRSMDGELSSADWVMALVGTAESRGGRPLRRAQ